MQSVALPQNLRDALFPHFGELSNLLAVGGGDTSLAVRADSTKSGSLFIKYSAGAAGQTYGAEADGLAALKFATADIEGITVPHVLAIAAPTSDCPGYLVLPWLQVGIPTKASWAGFGESLAALHLDGVGSLSDKPVGAYGWTRDNFLGPVPQPNAALDSWVDFFRERRLLAMAAQMRARGRWLSEWDAMLDTLSQKLDGRLPTRPNPALLHGDLWGGNVLAVPDKRFALIDPAVYVGDAEVDLAMTALFGGFPAAFYEGYHHVLPPVADEAYRRRVYQLYYLIMHLGVSRTYANAVTNALKSLV